MTIAPEQMAQVGARRITDLATLVEALPAERRARFDRLLRVSGSVGRLVPPPEMLPWIQKLFGSVAAVERQEIVKTTNLVTYEGTLFNALRASRPIATDPPEDLDQIVRQGVGDPFCQPLRGTPADVFGRVQGRHGITASNIAKYDAWHGVVVFDEHNPLAFSREAIADYFQIGQRWAEEVLAVDPEARYYFFMWNCLWKSGASILHGHAQVACTHGVHYARVEQLRAAAQAYRARHGSSYFDDLLGAHRDVGLVRDWDGVQVMATLTPIKEKEVWLVAPGPNADFSAAVYRVLDCFVHRLGVTSFNLVLERPPLRPAPEDWSGFPEIVRIVDRGALHNRTADIGAMELYASSVVSSDPFQLIAELDRSA